MRYVVQYAYRTSTPRINVHCRDRTIADEISHQVFWITGGQISDTGGDNHQVRDHNESSTLVPQNAFIERICYPSVQSATGLTIRKRLIEAIRLR